MKPIDPLTSLRFFAAFAIVLFHISGNAGVPKVIGLSLHQGVSFFFVLSGFILIYNYPALATWAQRRRFLVKRFARLWPANVVGIALTIYVEWGLYRHLDPWHVAASGAANIAMVQTWIPFHPLTGSINYPSWSIAVEFFLYFCFLFLIVDFARTWWWKLGASLLIAYCLIAIASALTLPWGGTGITDGSALLYVFPPARLFEFVLGMTAGLAFSQTGQLRGGNVMLWTGIEFAAITLVVIEMRLSFLYPMQTPLGWWLGQVYIAPFAALLIFVMAQGCGHVSRALSIAPLVFLGEISYSIYLLHFPLAKLYFITYKGAVPEWAELAGYLALLFAASILTYLLVERPARTGILWFTSSTTRAKRHSLALRYF